MTRFFVFLCAFLVNYAALSPASLAAEGPWATTAQSRARLLTGTQEGATVHAALEIELASGWHTYWKIPGDAGLPPDLDWSKTPGVASSLVHWPAPRRMSEAGIITFGHTGRLLLPLEIALKDPATPPATLDLNLSFMVCNNICIPEQLTLSAAVDNDATTHKRIMAARDALPGTDHARMGIETVVASPDALAIVVQSRDGFEGVDVIAAAGDRVFTATPNIALTAHDITKAMVTLEKPTGMANLNDFLAGKTLEVLLTRGDEAMLKTINF